MTKTKHTPSNTRFSMSRFAATIIAAAVAFVAVGCKEKSEAEKQEEKRDELRDKKRENAIKYFKELHTRFPDDPRAQEALNKAKALEASKPKK
jgi:outer membrane protein assembly factor BamD (BamD/ComL family)